MRIPHPWVFGASLWLSLSLLVSLEVFRSLGTDHLFEFSGLLSLLWLQFGFAGLFHTLRNGLGRNLVPLALITLLPPLLLFLFNLYLAR